MESQISYLKTPLIGLMNTIRVLVALLVLPLVVFSLTVPGRTHSTRLSAVSGDKVYSYSHSKKVGVIIVDHGSRKAQSNDRLLHLVKAYKSMSNLPVVEPAHMELSEPSIATAFNECVKQGATQVVCYPYFLSPGRHVQEDIPQILNEAAAAHPGIPFFLTEPLGMHEEVLRLVDDTIQQRVREISD